jgi:ribonuclease HI
MSGKRREGQRTGDPIVVYSDGAARGNPGPAGIGGQAFGASGELLAEISEYLGETTNNVAEYWGLIRILEEVRAFENATLRIRTDSELVANQITGGFKVKSRSLRPLVDRVKQLLAGYGDVEVEHVPREKNTACDNLANRAVDEGLAGEKKPLLGSVDDTLF